MLPAARRGPRWRPVGFAATVGCRIRALQLLCPRFARTASTAQPRGGPAAGRSPSDEYGAQAFLPSTTPPSPAAATAAAASREAPRGDEVPLWRVVDTVRPHAWPLDRPDIRARVVASLALMVGSKVCTVATPLLFKQAVDALADTSSAQHPSTNAAVAAAAAAAPAFVAPALGLLCGYAALRVAAIGMQEWRNGVFATVANGAARALARDLFRRLHGLDGAFHAAHPAAALSRTVERSMRAAQSLLTMLVLHIAPTALELGLVGALLWNRCGPAFAGVAAVTVAVYVGFTFGVTAHRNRLRKALNNADNALHAEFGDSLLNRELVQLYGGLALARARYEAKLAVHEAGQLQVASSLAWLNFGQGAIFSSGVAAVTLLAADGCVRGTMTVGDVVLANGLLFQLSIPLNLLGMVYREFHTAVTDLGAALRVLDGAAEGGLGADLVRGAGAGPSVPTKGVSGGSEGRGAGLGTGEGDGGGLPLLAEGVRAHGIAFENVSFSYEPVESARGAVQAISADVDSESEQDEDDEGVVAAGPPRTPRLALDNVSFEVPFGKTVAVVGGSGSGKSTVLRLIAALATPTSGTVRLGGTDLRLLDGDALRKGVAVVAQESALFRDSVAFNVGYSLLAARARRAEEAGPSVVPSSRASAIAGRTATIVGARWCGDHLCDRDGLLSRLTHEEAEEVAVAAERAQLAAAVAKMDDGYGTQVGDRGSRLSGGERQRVSLARAFTRTRPSNKDPGAGSLVAGVDNGGHAAGGDSDSDNALILLCDEPTSALDVLTEARVLSNLRDAGSDRCTVIVTHRLATCLYADEIIVLRHGRVAERGTHDVLVRRAGGEYARMWRTQQDAQEDAEITHD